MTRATDTDKDPQNVERGPRAAINNPRVSERVKEHDREILEKEFQEDVSGLGGREAPEEGKDPGNVARGLKAAIHNPNVSEKAKEQDRQRLERMGEQENE
ncbi:hypothetical protein FALCPG4_015077 [Fusarium falciforme]